MICFGSRVSSDQTLFVNVHFPKESSSANGEGWEWIPNAVKQFVGILAFVEPFRQFAAWCAWTFCGGGEGCPTPLNSAWFEGGFGHLCCFVLFVCVKIVSCASIFFSCRCVWFRECFRHRVSLETSDVIRSRWFFLVGIERKYYQCSFIGLCVLLFDGHLARRCACVCPFAVMPRLHCIAYRVQWGAGNVQIWRASEIVLSFAVLRTWVHGESSTLVSSIVQSIDGVVIVWLCVVWQERQLRTDTRQCMCIWHVKGAAWDEFQLQVGNIGAILTFFTVHSKSVDRCAFS